MWSQTVQECTFIQSCFDDVAPSTTNMAAQTFCCLLCSAPRPAFCSAKALGSHQRACHGVRNPMRAFADADGECPICRIRFQSRLRLLSHLSDTCRPQCRDKLLSGCVQPLPLTRIQELDALDKESRRLAMRQGHTHPLAVGSATRPDGRRVGRVQR